MRYPYTDFLRSLGFRESPEKLGYPPAGTVYTINTEKLSGVYWFYAAEDFSLNIHDFNVRETMIIHTPTDFNDDMATLSYIKSAVGEGLSPYTTISQNTIFCSFRSAPAPTFILHGGFPYLSVGFEFRTSFWQRTFSPEKRPAEEEIEDILRAVHTKESVRGVEKLADEILAFRGEGIAADLFYEAKAKELLSVIFEARKTLDSASSGEDERLEILRRYIDENISRELPQDKLTRIALLGKSKLKESFKKRYDMTITEYIQRRRIALAERLMLSTELDISEIAASVGYRSHSRFSALFKRYKGMTPLEFREIVRSQTKKA